MDKEKTGSAESSGDVGGGVVGGVGVVSGGGGAGVTVGRELTGKTVPSSSQQPAPKKPALKPPAAGASVVKKPQPAVIWDDKKSMEQQRTFYNDSTPPPSPSYMADSNNSPSIRQDSTRGSSAPRAQEAYDYSYDRVAPPAPIPHQAKPWQRKRLVWVIGGVALVVILALAIGLGVGLSTNSGSSGDDTDDHQDSAVESDAIPSISSSSSPTTTFTAPSSTQTIETSGSGVCPAANNTLFDVEGSSKTFRRYCGIDYSSSEGTKDLAIVWTASMQDCITNCAGFDDCTACGWGAMEGDSYKDNHRCFLKTNLGKPQKARDGWDFAVLEK